MRPSETNEEKEENMNPIRFFFLEYTSPFPDVELVANIDMITAY